MDAYNPHESEKRNETEDKLRSILTDVCEKIYPTSGFEIDLEGIHPNLLGKNELEAFSGQELSANKGASINLRYNPETDTLELNSLTHPLRGTSDSQLGIFRTLDTRNGLKYILAVIGTGNSREPFLQPTLTDDRVMSILNGYGLSEIPHPSHESYQLWRAELLSKCEDGWRITEGMTLLTGFDAGLEETTEIKHETTYRDGGQATIHDEICHTASRPDSKTTRVESEKNCLIEEAEPDRRTINAVNEKRTEEFDPFVENMCRITSQKNECIEPEEALGLFKVIANTVDEVLKYRN